jgi:hypothetical protein
MKVKVPAGDALAGLAGPPPTHPPSPPLREAGVGGRGGLAGRVLPGNSEQGREVALASLFSGLGWCLNLAGISASFFRAVKGSLNLGTHFGVSIWRFI